MNRPTVSIIIPTYNAAKYLDTTIKSALNQTFNDFELLIIDDGSTDNTKEIVKAFDDTRIKYFYQSNQGKCHARNKGIFSSSGRFISFLDADDFYYKNKLKNLLEFLNKNPHIGCVAGGVRRVSENGRTIFKKIHTNNRIITIEDLLYGNPINVCSTLIRSEYVKKINGFDIRCKRGEDWEFHYRLALNGCTIVVIKDIVCAYRFRKNAVQKTDDIYCHRMLDVTKNMFENDALPAKLRELKNVAFSSTYLRLSARCYASNNMMLGMENLRKALHYDPTVLDNNHKKILVRFVHWIHHFNVDNTGDLIKRIFDNLPEECESLKKNRFIIIRVKILLFLRQIKEHKNFQRFVKPVRLTLLKIIRMI
jgi:glycosyltransferase involved in cell wall biosynthesis